MHVIGLILISFLTLVEFNVENLFDTEHDSLKNDLEYTPESNLRWTTQRYWQKLNNIGTAIIACGEDAPSGALPDLIAMAEVENDNVMHDLTKRSVLRNAGYEYIMTDSPDERGIDVALVYQPLAFAPINSRSLRVDTFPGRGPTRDILYVSGRVANDDTLHLFIVHAPSRRGGEEASRPFRLSVAVKVGEAIDSIRTISPKAKIIVTGDLNAYSTDASLAKYGSFELEDVSRHAEGRNGAGGTYRYKGEWNSLDHVLVSRPLQSCVLDVFVCDNPFLTEPDETYGGVKPRRTYNGYKYNRTGTSDHLPLVTVLKLDK